MISLKGVSFILTSIHSTNEYNFWRRWKRGRQICAFLAILGYKSENWEMIVSRASLITRVFVDIRGSLSKVRLYEYNDTEFHYTVLFQNVFMRTIIGRYHRCCQSIVAIFLRKASVTCAVHTTNYAHHWKLAVFWWSVTRQSYSYSSGFLSLSLGQFCHRHGACDANVTNMGKWIIWFAWGLAM